MSDGSKKPKPYLDLGVQLKTYRERISESLADVSGAVEIDIKELASFELGQKRPAEDILLLLISHFGAKDDEALKLWQLAGYDSEKVPTQQMINDDDGFPRNEAMVINGDEKVVYTDLVHVMVNNFGVVVNFMQAGPNMKPLAVARVGMSKEHARSVLEVLQATLDQSDKTRSEPKQLTDSTSTGVEVVPPENSEPNTK